MNLFSTKEILDFSSTMSQSNSLKKKNNHTSRSRRIFMSDYSILSLRIKSWNKVRHLPLLNLIIILISKSGLPIKNHPNAPKLYKLLKMMLPRVIIFLRISPNRLKKNSTTLKIKNQILLLLQKLINSPLLSIIISIELNNPNSWKSIKKP